MDENKNWVHWKYFDAYAEFKLIQDVTSGNKIDYIYENTGLYLVAGCNYQSAVYNSFITDGTRIELYPLQTVNASSMFLYAIYASNGDELHIATSTPVYQGHTTIYYLGSNYERASMIEYQRDGNTQTTRSKSISNATDTILLAMVHGSGCRLTYDTSIRDQVSNSTTYFCCSTARETGSASVTTMTGSAQGSGTLITILQLS